MPSNLAASDCSKQEAIEALISNMVVANGFLGCTLNSALNVVSSLLFVFYLVFDFRVYEAAKSTLNQIPE